MEPLMKRGNWLCTLVHIRKVGEVSVMDKYNVGLFETAQDAFAAGNEYISNNVEQFKQGDRELPESMVLELLGYGVYPDSAEEQFAFGLCPNSNYAYLDVHGVTRGSYMARRAVGE